MASRNNVDDTLIFPVLMVIINECERKNKVTKLFQKEKEGIYNIFCYDFEILCTPNTKETHLRMCEDSFDKMCRIIVPFREKQDTNFSRAIPTRE